jgi:hypothetical protein
MIEWVNPKSCIAPTHSFETRKSSMQRGELADLHLAFPVSEEAAAANDQAVAT